MKLSLGALATFAAVIAVASPAGATGFTDIGQDIVERDKTEVELDGYLRVRGEALENFDLDRGPTPSGQPLFLVSQADPRSQTLTRWDMRMRTDLRVYAPGGTLAVKVRADVLDNLALGSAPDGIPSATTSQRALTDPLRIKRAYGEALLPFGVLAAGRMGSHWGLGILTNGGDCLDCDSGDATDRVALISPLLGHILAFAYDFSATGPLGTRPGSNRTLGLEPTTDVTTVTAALLRYKDDASRARRQKAGKATAEYGAYVSHRWQKNDIPAAYLPTAQPIVINDAQVMARGYHATALDAWARLSLPSARIEAEVAYLMAQVDQPSLLPGVLFHVPVTSRQLGAALESDIGAPDGMFSAGLDAGYASGDSAPGFGVTVRPNAAAPKPGDLDGAQANPPGDTSVDNFRFHPDYRIDRILFREIIGAVTDCVYARPHARLRLARFTSSAVTAHVAGVASTALYSESTPGLQKPLGVEIDPTLAYESRDGLMTALEYAVLFPLAGLDNPALHLNAKPAQLLRVRIAYVF